MESCVKQNKVMPIVQNLNKPNTDW